MATLRSIAFSFCSFAALGVVGCQQQQVASIPAPNFNGPVVVARSASPLAVKPLPVAPTPQTTKQLAGVPKEWIPPVAPRPWKWIVVHHSATSSGSARIFDRMHREKGWDELGYDFVIGNGTDSGNGQIEVGSRWTKQKVGAHAKTPNNDYNERGIGICLVGNFDIERPTAEQMKALSRLTAYLMKTYRIAPGDILGHGQTGRATDCPGRYMSIASLRRQATQLASESGAAPSDVAIVPEAVPASSQDESRSASVTEPH